MSHQRGDVVLATLPFVTRPGSKLRPVLVVQNDTNNARMQNTILAFISINLSRSHLPTQVTVDVSTPAGRQSGLIADSVVSCENWAEPARGALLRARGRRQRWETGRRE